jgi:hypothetical protein
MSIIWVAVVLLVVILYLGYRWKKTRKPSSQRRPKPPVTSSKPSETETSSSPSSLYSFSKQNLSAPKDVFKSNVSVQLPVAKSPVPPSHSSSLPTFPDLAAQLRELATQAWTTEESFRQSQLLLNPADFVKITSPTQVVDVLIRHAMRIVPGFSVPQMTPHVQVVSLPAAAGMFKVDEEGWVTIELGKNFFQDKLAAQAILAHEVCHYILENSGIRKSDVNLNERYTDLCMFICGFGEIFLAGYRRDAAQQDYRPGHRLGYRRGLLVCCSQQPNPLLPSIEQRTWLRLKGYLPPLNLIDRHLKEQIQQA